MPVESVTVQATNPTCAAHPRRVYAPIAVAVAACFGAVVMLNPGQGGLLSSASAQQAASRAGEPGETGMVSAAEQRKEIISQLRTLNSKIERLESMMSKGLSVKVTDMPALKIPREEK